MVVARGCSSSPPFPLRCGVRLSRPPAAAPNPQLDRAKRNVGLEGGRAAGKHPRSGTTRCSASASSASREFETTKYLTGNPAGRTASRSRSGVAGIPTAWIATMGIGQAGDRAGLRHRLHSAGVAEAGRRLARSDDRGRAGPRRRATTRGCRCSIAAALAVKKVMEQQHLQGTLDAVAGHRGGTGRHQGVLRARRGSSRTSTSRLFAHVGDNLQRHVGRRRQQRAGLGRVRSRARARTPPARAVARQDRRSTRSS